MSGKTQILLIDDHALVREAIASMLSTQPDFEVAGEVATIEDALEVVKTKHIDLVLLDIDLGSQKGGAFVNLARSAGFKGRILVVTAGVSKVEATRLLQNGCSGVLSKHERPRLLMERIRKIVDGSEETDPSRGKTAVDDLLPADKEPNKPLTPRQLQVFRRVFNGRSNKEIATELGISESMVKSFVQQLFHKTQVHSRAQLVRVAIERYWSEIEEG